MLAMATVASGTGGARWRLRIVASMAPAAMLASVMIMAVTQTSAHGDLPGRVSRDLLKQSLLSVTPLAPATTDAGRTPVTVKIAGQLEASDIADALSHRSHGRKLLTA